MKFFLYFWDNLFLNMTKINSFSKAEHLCGEKRITSVYTEGEAFIAYPFRVVFLIKPKVDDESVKVLVGVPKKRFKKAVTRNRLKRLMRESYRLNKYVIKDEIDKSNFQIQIAFNYVSNDELDYVDIEKKMNAALQKLVDKIHQKLTQ